ncbi:unnamed protein product [Didymodactylos carnosus]|uniref:ornithine decarboxylase n=1 Tax=Didymodactylos carnosus TaxID=1234261 RepID=A0A814W478_9BILA|nr:unnamed protein product [Didymodactylos carnosus]CAF1196494.1 unnamed protein product [Didymodactylos carnosus]CAF3535304.1 unnamed protein product [Didymodactylos carnosus]CAF3960878.1 unnamed protein product [Didymodactylos carnosus]
MPMLTENDDETTEQKTSAEVADFASKKSADGCTINACSPLTPVINSPHLRTIDEIVSVLQPSVPLYCIRYKYIKSISARFVATFPGTVLYAVKCNSDERVLQAVWEGGVHHFDCASPKEIELIQNLFPDGIIHFMNPIKNRHAIHSAYFKYGVRDFSVDTINELEKVIEVTKDQRSLGICVRLSVPNGHAMCDLSRKFGANIPDAVNILRRARSIAKCLGICFHVGSQCLDPAAYELALMMVRGVISQADVRIDVIDVGGGFPISYPNTVPPPLNLYFSAIERGFRALNLPAETAIWCEPGRALVAAACSLIVSVTARRDNILHINDGIFGNLHDAGPMNWQFPVRRIYFDSSISSYTVENFSFYGPACDDADFMQGPFFLPDDIEEGDFIEIGQIGAYTSALRTSFNGYGETLVAVVSDEPMIKTLDH